MIDFSFVFEIYNIYFSIFQDNYIVLLMNFSGINFDFSIFQGKIISSSFIYGGGIVVSFAQEIEISCTKNTFLVQQNKMTNMVSNFFEHAGSVLQFFLTSQICSLNFLTSRIKPNKMINVILQFF